MCALLWNHGTQYFSSKEYRACTGFYDAALEYAEASAKATIARGLALAHLALQELDRSAPPSLCCDEQQATCCLELQN